MDQDMAEAKKTYGPPTGLTTSITLPQPDGRTVALFVNPTTRLVVLDVVDADEQGGIEILRRYI